MINLLFLLFIFAVILFLLPLHPQKANMMLGFALAKDKFSASGLSNIIKRLKRKTWVSLARSAPFESSRTGT